MDRRAACRCRCRRPTASRSGPGATSPARRRRRRRSRPRGSRAASWPPPGMASRAFRARLTTICSIWPGSAKTLAVAAERLESSMCSPISRRSSLAVSSTTAPSAKTLGCSICWRPKASSWRVSAVARSAARVISSSRCRPQRLAGQLLAEHLAGAGDHLQEVVEVVGDAAGQLADRLHLLRLQQLDLAACAASLTSVATTSRASLPRCRIEWVAVSSSTRVPSLRRHWCSQGMLIEVGGSWAKARIAWVPPSSG